MVIESIFEYGNVSLLQNIMGKFNLEDYRHPWETGPHWELKKEFMEEYSHMFSEDRLLCLAQAYSNIVLMHCSYPEPVMRQISLLSKPLQMRKRFQESSTSEAEGSKSQQQKSKRKHALEDSEKSCKLIKFCVSEEEPSFPVPANSTNLHENVLKQSACNQIDCSSTNTSDNLSSDYNSTVTVNNQNQMSVRNSNAQASENVQNNKIVTNLGLTFIQNFVQEVRKFQSKALSASESISSAAQKLKIFSQVCFKINPIPGSPCHAPQFCSELNINGCVISSEQGCSKKKAKSKCAETAVNILINLASENSSGSNLKKLDATNILPCNSLCTNQQPAIEQCKDSRSSVSNSVVNFPKTSAVTSDMKILQTFSEIVARSGEFEEFMRIAKSINIHQYITFNTESSESFQKSQFTCQFLLKNILISSGKDASIKSAKLLAVESGFQKLKKISYYEIVDGKLKEKQTSNIDKPSNPLSSNSIMAKSCTYQSSSFVLNKKMFDASLRDGFVLLDNLSLQSVTQRNVRAMLSASASFSHKCFGYEFEEVSGGNAPSKKACVLIGNEIVATAIASTRDQAKVIACNKVLETLKKKYYTVKVKNEYNDGYIIHHNQVFEGESFSSNAITENNIGCKMLKSMGWTGGGLGASGIVEPVEAQGNNLLGRGLGYRKENCDLAQFKKRINAMLQDYSKTDTLSDLVFSKEFTKDERKEIHKIAQKYGLHTGSHGVNEDRFLTVRHKYTVSQVLLYLAKNGGSNSKFELVDNTNRLFELLQE